LNVAKICYEDCGFFFIEIGEIDLSSFLLNRSNEFRTYSYLSV